MGKRYDRIDDTLPELIRKRTVVPTLRLRKRSAVDRKLGRDGYVPELGMDRVADPAQ